MQNVCLDLVHSVGVFPPNRLNGSIRCIRKQPEPTATKGGIMPEAGLDSLRTLARFLLDTEVTHFGLAEAPHSHRVRQAEPFLTLLGDYTNDVRF